MSIAPDIPLRTGHYRDKRTGEVFFACNCGKQPANKTLRHIGSNREHYEIVTNPNLPAQTPSVPTTL